VARSESGLPIQPVYGASALDGFEAAAYRVAQEIDNETRTVIGVNKFTSDGGEPYQPLRVDPQIETDQRERLAALRRDRDSQAGDARGAGTAGDRRRGRARTARCVGRLRAPRFVLSRRHER
jgi:methylmalonyl-CoA mutase N-terminal domain/subunit